MAPRLAAEARRPRLGQIRTPQFRVRLLFRLHGREFAMLGAKFRSQRAPVRLGFHEEEVQGND